MDEKDIEQLFLDAATHPSQMTKPIRDVFSILVRSTFKYRDIVFFSRGITVTVQDIRVKLNWLVPALSSGELPKTDDKIKLDLLKI